MKEEKIDITLNQEDVQNIINCYEKDMNLIEKLKEKNEIYKSTIKGQHRRIEELKQAKKASKQIQKERNKILRQENERLKERIEYLERSNNRREESIIYLREENIDFEIRIEKAMEITKKLLMNSADNRLIAKEEEMEYFDWLDKILEKQLEILKGE